MRAGVTAAALAALVALAPPAVVAGTAETPPPAPGPSALRGAAPQTPEQARELARQVILLETRPNRRIAWVWRAKPKPPKAERKRDPKWLERLFETLEPALKPLVGAWLWMLRHGAKLPRILAFSALAVGLGLFLIHGRRLESWWGGWFAPAAAPSAPPEILFGLDVRPESLPDEPDEAARALFAAGRQREALALLYRAALSRCIHRWGLPLAPAMTELECARRIGGEAARAGSARPGEYFRRLTAHWIRTAYAHEALAGPRFQELAAGWREVFG